METQVLSIQPNATSNTFDVVVSMNGKPELFIMEVETDRIGEHEIQIAKSKDDLWEAFNHHPIATNIHKLVLSVYNQNPVDLPVHIDFL